MCDKQKGVDILFNQKLGLFRDFAWTNRLLWQEDATREDASTILLSKEMNNKEKSISILLLVSRDFLFLIISKLTT